MFTFFLHKTNVVCLGYFASYLLEALAYFFTVVHNFGGVWLSVFYYIVEEVEVGEPEVLEECDSFLPVVLVVVVRYERNADGYFVCLSGLGEEAEVA